MIFLFKGVIFRFLSPLIFRGGTDKTSPTKAPFQPFVTPHECSSNSRCASNPAAGKGRFDQWLFLVPLKGGRWHITPQKAIYKWYISGIYCQLGDYMPPTTF